MPAADPAVEMLLMDEGSARLKKGGEDPGLSALYFQLGRYLLMGSSRPGTMAAKRQGIWNAETAPPGDSKYTTNINVGMNDGWLNWGTWRRPRAAFLPRQGESQERPEDRQEA